MNVGARSFEIRGGHVLAAMALFFGVVIAVNAAFAVIAVRSFPGEDVRHSYVQGLHFNETLAERRAEAQLGWRASAEFLTATDGAAIEVSLVDKSGAPIDASLAAELERPTDSRLDRALQFERRAPGTYVANIGALAPGVWRLRARAEGVQGGALTFEAELIWEMRR
ncbi:MAG: FixH family protein [Terricaulis sp.]